MRDLERNTIVVEMRERLWRMRVWPNLIQMFPSREQAEMHARELACSKIPAWTVIVHEPETDEPLS
jgi:hypothetical protein